MTIQSKTVSLLALILCLSCNHTNKQFQQATEERSLGEKSIMTDTVRRYTGLDAQQWENVRKHKSKSEKNENLVEIGAAKMEQIFGEWQFFSIKYLKHPQQWQSRSEKNLVTQYDSLHPGNRLSRFQKADAMLKELETLFVDEPEYEKWQRDVMTAYRYIAYEKELLRQDCTFQKEVLAWRNLENRIDHFCVHLAELAYFGGSGVGWASNQAIWDIRQTRCNDLQQILKNSGKSTISTDSLFLAKTKESFAKAVHKTANRVLNTKEFFEQRYFIDDDDWRDGGKKQYSDTYQQMLSDQKPLIDAMDNWMNVRMAICNEKDSLSGENIKQSTSTLIKDFNLLIASCWE